MGFDVTLAWILVLDLPLIYITWSRYYEPHFPQVQNEGNSIYFTELL